MDNLTKYELNYILDTQGDYCTNEFLNKALKNKKYMAAEYPHIKFILAIKNEIANLIKNEIIKTEADVTKNYIRKYEKLATEYLK